LDKFRIAIVAPPWLPVPPERYGGVEWIVSLLADGLAELGHDVTLFAAGGSFTRARLATTLAEPQPFQYGRTLPELGHVLDAYGRVGDFDVVNDHSGLIAAALADLVGVPVCHTVHTPLTGREGQLYRGISALNPRLRFISMTMHQRAPAPDLPWLANCPSAIDLDAYPFAPRRGEYLAFLGRMSSEKGAAHAIAAAKALGMPLKLAGKMHEVAERDYFRREIAPYLGDGVEYLGEVTHEEKVRLLQGARCTLFPIEWEEPFGLVMIESMACGTPVAAVRRGAVPEVIDDGVSGVVVDDVADLAEAVSRADAIEPTACREHVEEHFSDRRMVRRYLDAYRLLLTP
jgi:glycosyltransferase involved in cell wall biosynthesis